MLKLKLHKQILIALLLTTSPLHAVTFDSAAFVAAHNKWRAEVGITEKLSYSPALAKSAQAWVNKLKSTNRCNMLHSKPNGKYGENLYWASAKAWSDGSKGLQQVTPGMVVDSWGSEIADYDYADNSCVVGKMCGHYTQMVWRNTRTVGCAMAVCGDSKEQVWACQYQPAGNRVGSKPY